jgi:hypothetical protein
MLKRVHLGRLTAVPAALALAAAGAALGSINAPPGRTRRASILDRHARRCLHVMVRPDRAESFNPSQDVSNSCPGVYGQARDRVSSESVR